MPSTRDIRRRIRSVKSTAQITKAMQMVASSKMRRAQEAAIAGRPYAVLLNRVLSEVSRHSGDFTHPLMEARDVRRRAVLVVSTDKGLCGALNSNLFREALKFETESTVFITAGRKASQFVARTRRKLAAEFSYKDTPSFGEARALAKFARELFLKGEVDEVQVMFTSFVNTLTQRPNSFTLLPVTEMKIAVAKLREMMGNEAADQEPAEFLFEPGPEVVLGEMLPHYINFAIYQVLLEAKASEHSARMVAMKNATDNAKQLVKDLSLEYNKLRQSMITNELLEISTAAMALG